MHVIFHDDVIASTTTPLDPAADVLTPISVFTELGLVPPPLDESPLPDRIWVRKQDAAKEESTAENVIPATAAHAPYIVLSSTPTVGEIAAPSSVTVEPLARRLGTRVRQPSAKQREAQVAQAAVAFVAAPSPLDPVQPEQLYVRRNGRFYPCCLQPTRPPGEVLSTPALPRSARFLHQLDQALAAAPPEVTADPLGTRDDLVAIALGGRVLAARTRMLQRRAAIHPGQEAQYALTTVVVPGSVGPTVVSSATATPLPRPLYPAPPRSRNAMLKLSAEERQPWLDAEQRELAGLQAMGTWGVSPRSATTRATPTLWAYQRKSDGAYKARLCVQGNRTPHEEHPPETSSPTASRHALMALLAVACEFNYDIRQLDAVQAYLNADIPLGHRYDISIAGFPMQAGTSLQLRKCLYGMAFSGREWWLLLDAYLRLPTSEGGLGFSPCLSERAVSLHPWYGGYS